MSIENTEAYQSNIKSIINLKIEGTYFYFKEEIVLYEEIKDKSRTYYFELKSNENPSKIFKKAISSIEINDLLYYVKNLKLEKNPEQDLCLDGAWVYLTIFDNYYEWMDPCIPKEWEPLEEVVSRLEKLSDFELFREENRKALTLEWLNIINLKKHHAYSLPKHLVVYQRKLEPAGIFYRINEAREFVKKDDIWLELEREPNNEYDSNAIKIFGCREQLRKHIGYLPKELAKVIVRLNLTKHVKAYLHWTYYDYIYCSPLRSEYS